MRSQLTPPSELSRAPSPPDPDQDPAAARGHTGSRDPLQHRVSGPRLAVPVEARHAAVAGAEVGGRTVGACVKADGRGSRPPAERRAAAVGRPRAAPRSTAKNPASSNRRPTSALASASSPDRNITRWPPSSRGSEASTTAPRVLAALTTRAGATRSATTSLEVRPFRSLGSKSLVTNSSCRPTRQPTGSRSAG